MTTTIITVKMVRDLLKSKDAVSYEGRIKAMSSDYMVWPLRLFGEYYPAKSGYIDESDLYHEIKGKFGRQYINGFNLGWDGRSQQFTLEDTNPQYKKKLLNGWRDARRILRCLEKKVK